jgi:hypothetical protein
MTVQTLAREWIATPPASEEVVAATGTWKHRQPQPRDENGEHPCSDGWIREIIGFDARQ